ncbi:MAG: class I SAM-dependent methyltransferase, partial [Gammaproteobacteria bacterium]
AAVALAKHYTQVIATDASAEQIEHAFPHSQVEYRIAPAERSGLAPNSVDLVTAAQAAHWFELPAFYVEVGRVTKPGGAVVLWCYGLCSITPEVDAVIEEFYEGESKPYWPPERRLIDAGYRTLELPFAEITTPALHMQQHWDLTQLLAYLRTWSAVQRFMKQTGRDPVPELEASLKTVWGAAESMKQIDWPLHFRAGHIV